MTRYFSAAVRFGFCIKCYKYFAVLQTLACTLDQIKLHVLLILHSLSDKMLSSSEKHSLIFKVGVRWNVKTLFILIHEHIKGISNWNLKVLQNRWTKGVFPSIVIILKSRHKCLFYFHYLIGTYQGRPNSTLITIV